MICSPRLNRIINSYPGKRVPSSKPCFRASFTNMSYLRATLVKTSYELRVRH